MFQIRTELIFFGAGNFSRSENVNVGTRTRRVRLSLCQYIRGETHVIEAAKIIIEACVGRLRG